MTSLDNAFSREELDKWFVRAETADPAYDCELEIDGLAVDSVKRRRPRNTWAGSRRDWPARGPWRRTWIRRGWGGWIGWTRSANT
ncbi:hypothetical protein [Parenemella sanctibonifatiensis]|uniref:hypothetical protein n=1 Tax=Parenemella sanctibonifatiensis TaxID=2016505 RepID=UPI003899026C